MSLHSHRQQRLEVLGIVYVESGELRTFGPDCDGRPRLAM